MKFCLSTVKNILYLPNEILYICATRYHYGSSFLFYHLELFYSLHFRQNIVLVMVLKSLLKFWKDFPNILRNIKTLLGGESNCIYKMEKSFSSPSVLFWKEC